MPSSARPPADGSEPTSERSIELFAEVARELAARDGREAVLAHIVTLAQQTVPGAQAAAVTMRDRKHQFVTTASTGTMPREVDAIQYETGEGPCLQAFAERAVVRCNDLATDDRWPTFAPKATEQTGVRSMLSHALFITGEHTLGALNLYATTTNAFNDESIPMVSVYATHSAIALERATVQEQSTQLQEALQSNRNIGMAMGVLMGRFNLTQQDAFDLLRMASQRRQRRIAAIALEVVETGTIDFP